MFLLGRAHVPGMSLGSRGPRRGSRTRRLCACFVLRFRLFGSVFLARRRGNRRGVRLGGLLFFLLLFRLFLNSTQLAQDFLALLRRLSSAGELRGTDFPDMLLQVRRGAT